MYPDLSIPGIIFPIRFENVGDNSYIGVVNVYGKLYYSLVSIIPELTQDNVGFNTKGNVLYIRTRCYGDRYVYDYVAAKYMLLEEPSAWAKRVSKPIASELFWHRLQVLSVLSGVNLSSTL